MKKIQATIAALCVTIGGGAWAETAPQTDTPVAQVAMAQDDAMRALMAAARMEPLMQVVATEGARHGLGLETALFPGKGGAAWERVVSIIQSPERMTRRLGEVMARELSANDATLAAAFLSDGLGAKVVQREVIARREMLDGTVEADAKRHAASLRADAAPRAALIDEMIEALDLVTVNVSGGLNANLAFYRGLGDGGAMKKRLTERDMLAMVWEQEDDVRDATRTWLRGYLVRAYAPLSDAELHAYVDFAETRTGRRYLSAMFAGFGTVFEETSYDLGLAAARFIIAQDA